MAATRAAMPPNPPTLTPTAWALVRSVEEFEAFGATAVSTEVKVVEEAEVELGVAEGTGVIVDALAELTLDGRRVEVWKVAPPAACDVGFVAELDTETSTVVVVTPDVIVGAAGSVSVSCVGGTSPDCAEQTP
jgi:hypothetical protein